MIIGITGHYGSGKDTAADYFIGKGYTKFSLSDILRKEAMARGMVPDREALICIGNELRTTYGPGVLALRARKTFGTGNYVVPSIRNPGEIIELRKDPRFIILALDAPSELRYQRHIKQERPDQIKTYGEFVASEKREESADAANQQLHLCVKMADALVLNDGSKDAFFAKLERAIRDVETGALKQLAFGQKQPVY